MSDVFLEHIERAFKAELPSVIEYKMRPSNNSLWVSFESEADFLKAVRSASGVNIGLEVGWRFGVEREEGLGISACYLRFDLANNCIDERLTLFLKDLALPRRR
ncbi:hypothetical protein [Stenotrophomonas sp. PS02289]|uniref:hypothetical protein n=1 Tax=Stenotrophomonas sp. PS02289 TaxID=2991422 RepID=UPI00249AAA8C|nr:hypothetical protein [Stenotrophomonas sp. PS02289]